MKLKEIITALLVTLLTSTSLLAYMTLKPYIQNNASINFGEDHKTTIIDNAAMSDFASMFGSASSLSIKYPNASNFSPIAYALGNGAANQTFHVALGDTIIFSLIRPNTPNVRWHIASLSDCLTLHQPSDSLFVGYTGDKGEIESDCFCYEATTKTEGPIPINFLLVNDPYNNDGVIHSQLSFTIQVE